MTGAAIPEGADMVFMVEDSSVLTSGKVRFTGSSAKDNISPRGEDIRLGEIILKKGTLLRPQDLALLAMAGRTSVKAGKQPVVAVISSGNELVEPSEKPGLSSDKKYQLLPAYGTDRECRWNWQIPRYCKG